MLLKACAEAAGVASDVNEKTLAAVPDGGPSVVSYWLGPRYCSDGAEVDTFVGTGVKSSLAAAAAAAAFSSFFFSRSALPPCRKSNPDIVFVKLFGPGESGVKEYSGCGLSGLVGCEFECADESGS